MKDLPLIKLWDLHKALRYPDDVLDALDLMEELLPDLKPLVNMSNVEALNYGEDDTTAVHVFKMRTAVQDLYTMMEHLASEYVGISNDEKQDLEEGLCEVLTGLAVVYYVKFGLGDVIEDLVTKGIPDFAGGGYSPWVVKQDKSRVLEYASTLVAIFNRYTPYLPEYFLDDEELGALYANLSEGKLSVAEMTAAEVQKKLEELNL
jgi:hypothetical protein